MTTPSPSPAHIPLPSSPSSRRSSRSTASASAYHRPTTPSTLASQSQSPRVSLRPRLDRGLTSLTVRQERTDPFYEGTTVFINQPVGSLSISPSHRDVCLASRKGLYILDLANLHQAPRFIPQGGTWQIADCQWSPHPATSNLILSTSSQKLLVWDLAAQQCLYKSIDAHARAITDINWHALNPNLMATVSMDAGIRGWDLRAWDRPFMRLCAWGAAGTQVKWNRQHEHLLATAHGKEVIVWDNRKGSVPVVVIKAHDAKIYGIDWDRQWRHKLVTCSLDKTIKFWTVPELRTLGDATTDFWSELNAPDEPAATITTNYPVWRARNLPFGHGVISLPQRGDKALEMYALGGESPVHRFEGHDDVVKEFVWRARGGEQADFDDREFQLVTWSKDRTLRIWPVQRELTEKVGFTYGAPIKVLVSRRGAPNITYTKIHEADQQKLLPPPIINPPSGIARQRLAKVDSSTAMTRGGAKTKGVDQLEWLTKVVKNQPSPDSSAAQSRMQSLSRKDSRSTSTGRTGEWMSLKDEVVLIDLHHRKLTMSMNGPWANGNRMAFMRIHWSFPPNYPYSSDLPTFELERNPTVSPIARLKIVTTIKEMRAANRQCLVSTCGFLLGSQERTGRRMVEEESDSESEKGAVLNYGPVLARTSGATFGPNGQLVCFFPKQTVLPRVKALSRSPSVTRDQQRNPLIKAMSALSRLENPRQRASLRIKPKLRRFENTSPQVQAGSTVTVHDVSFLGNPDPSLARVYSSLPENNLYHAMEAKRYDHADIWAALRALLSDPPPPYSRHPPLGRDLDTRKEREIWEKGIARKRELVDQIYATLIAARDLQMLALVSVALLEHIRATAVPPQPETLVQTSPEQDYFGLPRVSSFQGGTTTHTTPVRSRSSITPASPGPSSYRTSGWSQILNPSSISLRGAITPRDRASFDLPFSKTPLGMSFDESPTANLAGISGFSIPVPPRKPESPRLRERPRHPVMASSDPSQPPQASTPLRSAGTERSLGSSGDVRAQKVSFGSASPLRRNFSRGNISASNVGQTNRRKVRVCSVKIEMPQDDSPSPSLLPRERRVQAEGWKLLYADYLLRIGLLGPRAALLQYNFLEGEETIAGRAAAGEPPSFFPPKLSPRTTLAEEQAIICAGCVSGPSICPVCGRRPNKPHCAFCRLPIKGLSTTCTICNHKTHVKCFRTHFPSASTCPACPCRCLLDHGTSAPSISFVQAPSSPSISRAQGRGSISPVLPGAREGRLNYANLANLAGMVNMLGPIRESSETRTDALGFSPENTSGLAERAGAVAGAAHPQGGVAHPRPEGLLARARGLTAEGLLHWSRMEDR